jgi:hypothetical protein
MIGLAAVTENETELVPPAASVGSVHETILPGSKVPPLT